jgi:hypothetical protein
MYTTLVLPFVAGLIAQICKMFIKNNHCKFNLQNLFSYSGMPSTHSAIMVGLASITLFEYGLDSPLFAISLIMTVLVIRDALGLRRYIGQHGEMLNDLVKDLKDDDVLDEKYPRLKEKIGHTPLQVFAGSVIGFLVSLLGYLLI